MQSPQITNRLHIYSSNIHGDGETGTVAVDG